MTLYFENPVNFSELGAISTNEAWHPNFPLLAVASYSQEKGGFVTIFDDLGEPLRDVEFPYHSVSQVTALSWHPERNILATGWENGELKVWTGNEKDFVLVNGPHKAPITLLEFSERGGRLVSCDATGSLVGWKVDSRGQVVTAFHHDLKESITHLTFRLTVKSQPEFDVEGLAKAAVNGDEHALDLFSNWRPKTTARKFRVQDGTDNLCFFVGTQTGSIYYVNQGGACTEVLNTEGVPLSYILYHHSSESVIVMMEGLTIGQFRVDFQGHLSEIVKVKMSGRLQGVRGASSQGLVWAGGNSLAVLTGDLIVRIWDIETNDNYVLPTNLKNYDNNEELSRQINEMFTCMSFCKINQSLCAGTNAGRIYFWVRKLNKADYRDPDDAWELQNISSVSGTVKQVHWGSVNLRAPLLSVNCVTRVYVMKEQTLSVSFHEKIWATQKNAMQILLQNNDDSCMLNLEIQVSDLCVNQDYLVATNGRVISVYGISRKSKSDDVKSQKEPNIATNLLFSFTCENERILLHNKDIITMFGSGITVRTNNGSVLSNIPVTGNEGEPIGMDLCGNNLTVFTIEGYLKIYDLSERELKLLTPAKNMYDLCNDFGEIIQARTNSNGTRVVMTIAAANLIPDGKLYIWDIESDTMVYYDFRKDTEPLEFEEFAVKTQENSNVFDSICTDRLPLKCFWDIEDPRMLVCNAKKLKMVVSDRKNFGKKFGQVKTASKPDLETEEQVIVTMFYSPENGIKIQDIRATDGEARLLGIATPYIAILHKQTVQREVMNDFNGLETCNKLTKDAVLDFSYNLSLGNMDAAFKAIKLVQSSGVWNSLARMCVKTRRLDVAGVCLGHMGNARAAKLLRQAIADTTLPQEAKLAVLAVQLGMLEEAEQLYIQCERYDLLNKLNQSRNKMDAAINIAQTKDRIHLRNTEHAWGRSLEQQGNFKEAIVHYEKANTHRYDVPRMLMDQQEQLQAYMSKTTDPEILKWWGQYIESQGDMAAALRIYSNASDIYSQVRVLCFLGEETRASDLARTGNDKAAFYHMARHYETTGNIEDAVGFFTRANAYSNAVRICKENNMMEELWNIGTVAGNREKLECARYFEEVGSLDKAVILYHRAGMLHKALDLAFKTRQFDTLQQIATELDADSDPALIKKCADYFITNEQFDKAVDLLAIGKKYREAIAVCLEKNVQLTEDLAEKLTPEKDEIDDESRISVLENLAESLMKQGNYHLATKKFTQAGDKIRAMKSLLKSGDTDKIIFFAGVSRQREIYIMAANYLQSLDWQNQPEILRNIITFYSKGKALDLLANFYVACAQVEIDEFQNYEKAFGALTEASRALAKVTQPKDAAQHRRATEIVQQQLTTVKRFVDIKRIFERGDISTGMVQCKQLLNSGGKELESSVRRGDIYALMIQMAIKSESFAEAKQMFFELRQILSLSNLPVNYYINRDVLEALAKGLGVPVASLVPATSKSTEQSQDDDEIVEEVVDD